MMFRNIYSVHQFLLEEKEKQRRGNLEALNNFKALGANDGFRGAREYFFAQLAEFGALDFDIGGAAK